MRLLELVGVKTYMRKPLSHKSQSELEAMIVYHKNTHTPKRSNSVEIIIKKQRKQQFDDSS